MTEHPKWRSFKGAKALAALALCAAATILAPSAFGLRSPTGPPANPSPTSPVCSAGQELFCDVACSGQGFCGSMCTNTDSDTICDCYTCDGGDPGGGCEDLYCQA